MGNIRKKIEKNLKRRQQAYDALPADRRGFKRPGSSKKKGK